MRTTAIFALLLVASTARAQDVGAYLKDHGTILAGVAVIDGHAEKLVQVGLSDRYDFGAGWKGGYRVALFSVARAGKIQPTGLPSTVSDLKAYSDGEVWIFGSRAIRGPISVEAIGGVTFKTASFAGPDVNPLDGTKVAALIGVVFEKNGYVLGFDGGHYGPVVEQGKVASLLPSLVLHTRIPMGAKATLVGEAAFGRLLDKTLAQSYRGGIETRF